MSRFTPTGFVLVLVLGLMGAASARVSVPNDGSCDGGLEDAEVTASCVNCAKYTDGRKNGFFGQDCVLTTKGFCFPKKYAENSKNGLVVSSCGGSSNPPPAPAPAPAPAPRPYSGSDMFDGTFEKPSGTKLRVASYNCMGKTVVPVKNDKVDLNSNNLKLRMKNFQKVVKAVDADVWVLQEFFYGKSNLDDADDMNMEEYMKKITGKTWYASGDTNTDNSGEFLLSRYPIRWDKNAGRRTFASLIDLSSIKEKDLLIVNVHMMKLDHAKDTADFMDDFINDRVKAPSSDVTVMVAGDFNDPMSRNNGKRGGDGELLGARYKKVQESLPGLVNLQPLHLNSPMERKYSCTKGYAVRTVTGDVENDAWSHRGGMIDYLLVKENGMQVSNTFIMNTFRMKEATLKKYDLKRASIALKPEDCTGTIQKGDECETDHLPLIADFGGSGSFNDGVSNGRGVSIYDSDSDDDTDENTAASGSTRMTEVGAALLVAQVFLVL